MEELYNPIYYQLARNDSEITEKKSVGRQSFVKKNSFSFYVSNQLARHEITFKKE